MHDVHDQLREWSSSLGDSIDSVEIEAVTAGSSSTTVGSNNRRWALIAASLVAVAFGGVAVVVALGGDDTVRTTPTPIDTVGSSVPATDPVATTDAAPTTEASDTTIEPDIFDPSLLPSSDVFDPVAGGPTLSGASTVSFAGLPLQDISVSPSGRWIAVNRSDSICLLDTTLGTADPADGCVETGPPSVAPGSLVWSPDESRIAFYENPFQAGRDSDIYSMDVASGAIESLTDDGTDDFELEDPDILPFFDADGTLYFFRLGSEPGTSTLFEFGDELTPRGVMPRGLPTGIRPDGDGWAVRLSLSSEDGALDAVVRIDSDFSVSDPIELEGLPSLAGFVDVENGRALVPQTRAGRIGLTLLDLSRPDSPTFVPETMETSDRAITGAGLSPDGSKIALIVEHRTDPSGHQLVVAPILDDGSVGPLGVVATGEEFAPNDGDVTIRPRGLGDQREIVWTDDKITYGLGPNELVTLDIST